MPYLTGQAASFTDVMLAIRDAAALAGWTDHGGSALAPNQRFISRPGCAVRLVDAGDYLTLLAGVDITQVASQITENGQQIIVSENTLVDPAPNLVRMGRMAVDNAWRNIQFPVLYDVMAFADEIYCFINHNVLEYQYLAFGVSGVPGILGTGAWCSGTFGANSPSTSANSPGAGSFQISEHGGMGDIETGRRLSGAIFSEYGSGTYAIPANIAGSFVHHGFTDYVAGPWLLGHPSYGRRYLSPLLGAQPSAWNDGAALLPIRAFIPRPQRFVSLAADLRHARHIRVDFLDQKEVYSLGAERWKIFPWVKKDITARNGGGAINHSGTFGVAIRYDGP